MTMTLTLALLGTGYALYAWRKRRLLHWEFDCSTPGNKVCAGVWTRQIERHRKCTGET